MSYKKFNLDEDIFNNNYILKENIEIEHFWLTGGYFGLPDDNVKFPHHYTENNISGSYFVEIYDKLATDVSAIKLMTLSYGYTSSSTYYSGSGFVGTEQSHKLKMYRLFAKRLLGDENKKFNLAGREINEAIFLCPTRNQFRDGIFPNSTTIYFFSGNMVAGRTFGSLGQSVGDGFASPHPKVSIQQEFAGRFTNLLNGNSYGWFRGNDVVGLCFLEAGVFVIDPSIRRGIWSGSFEYDVLAKGVSGTTYRNLLCGVKSTFGLIQFTNYSNVQSIYYKCTAEPYEFNYSSNPSFINQNREVITQISSSSPTTYITQVGLLGENQELIAVAKLYKPIKKNPNLGVKITVRLDH